jgi:hypothetical protein
MSARLGAPIHVAFMSAVLGYFAWRTGSGNGLGSLHLGKHAPTGGANTRAASEARGGDFKKAKKAKKKGKKN